MRSSSLWVNKELNILFYSDCVSTVPEEEEVPRHQCWRYSSSDFISTWWHFSFKRKTKRCFKIFFLLWMQQSEGLSSRLSIYLMYFWFILNGPISNRSPRWKCEINPSDTGNVPSAMLGTFSSLSLTLASLPLEAAQPEAVKYKNTLHIYHSRSSNNVIVCGRTRIWRNKQSRAAS